MRRRKINVLLAVIPALVLGFVGAPATIGQDTGPNPAGPVTALHEGDCRRPQRDAAFELATLAATADGDTRGQAPVAPLLTGSGTVAVGLADLLDPDQPYVLLVHENATAFETLLACGEIGGPIVDDQITFALRPLNDAGYAGVAALADTEEGTAGSVVIFADVNALAPAAAPSGATRQRASDQQPPASGQQRGGTRGSGGSGANRGGAPPIIGGLEEEPAAVPGSGGDADATRRPRRTPRAQRTPRATETAIASATGVATTPPEATDAIATDVSTTVTPSVTEPVATEPVATEPVATKPVATEPAPTEPVATEPVVTDPEPTAPISTEPAVPDPVEPEPIVTEPAGIEPTAETVEG